MLLNFRSEMFLFPSGDTGNQLFVLSAHFASSVRSLVVHLRAQVDPINGDVKRESDSDRETGQTA